MSNQRSGHEDASLTAKLREAVTHHQSSRPDRAEALYREVLDADPDHAEALYLFGFLLLQVGRLDDAAVHLARAAERAPENVDAHLGLGLVERERGRLDDACRAFERAAKADPAHPGAANNLGTALHELGRLEEAARAYRRAAELAPDRPDIRCSLGDVLIKLGDHDGARESLDQALRIDPGFADAHFALGQLAAASGDLEAAVGHFRRAIANDPDGVRAPIDLGTTLMELGRLEEARETYRKVLELDPAHAKARFLLTRTRTFAPGDPEIAVMEDLLARCPDEDGKVYLGFALAKAWDDAGDVDKAFARLAEANRLMRSTIAFDGASDAASAERTAAAFKSELSAQARAVDSDTPAPLAVFIVGMPRSGTTLIEQILASHSQVFGGGERDDLPRLAAAHGYPEAVAALAPDGLAALGRSYLDALAASAADAPCVTDKTPMNFLHVGMIRLCLPGAKVIHCVRDPMDTCLSCYRELFESGQDFSYDLAELGAHYRGYHRLMAHWRDVYPGFVHDLVYEDLIADPEAEIRRLLAFVGLSWEDACLDFHRTERPVRTASMAQVRQPLYGTAVARWKRYAAHLGPLIEALGPLGPKA